MLVNDSAGIPSSPHGPRRGPRGLRRPKRTLAEAAPHLLAEWDEAKGGPSPYVVGPDSHQVLHWFHYTEEGVRHEWQATAGSRYRMKSGCGVCHPRKGATPGINDLATTHPELAALWCGEHNGTLTAQRVTAGSKKTVCWVCAHGHHVGLRVDARRRNGCLGCSGQRAMAGDPTTLAVVEPEWFAQLDLASVPDGVDPLTITFASNRRLTWTCEHCASPYVASPNERRAGVGCRECSKQASRVERDLRLALRVHFPDLVGPHRLPIPWNSGAPVRPNRKSMNVDMYSAALELVVEYDGLVSHRDEDRRRVDQDKTGLLLEAGYRVIRVRENELGDLPLHDPALLQVQHEWGSDLSELVGQILAWVERMP